MAYANYGSSYGDIKLGYTIVYSKRRHLLYYGYTKHRVIDFITVKI